MLWIVAALLSQPTVSLSSVTGGMLASLCSVDRGMQLDPCASYILGVADALQVDRVTCRPHSEAATIQTLAIVRRYIREHPENWGWSPVTLVKVPLMEAFPCNRG